MSAQQMDYQQRLAEAQWAIGQCLKHNVPQEAIAVLAYECGFNQTDMKHIIQSIQEAA
jgi:hypothetical protein